MILSIFFGGLTNGVFTATVAVNLSSETLLPASNISKKADLQIGEADAFELTKLLRGRERGA